ncbi:polyprenol monophosphomannose synthase [Candidatus Woesearchaeota archaeon]|nr:MAG: polyprenol monophosphomannose synthase [Candidatus Woesearchaeota archaeon]
MKNENIMSAGNSTTMRSAYAVCIIVPTYNEADNIKKLIDVIYDQKKVLQYAQEHIDMNVLVVDDNSPDGTADVVKTLQRKNKKIHLLQRKEKNGLGAAYIAGMKHAMQSLHPDVIFEMDGDLSHDPKYIMTMIDEIRNGKDFVIGSRYVAGGSIPENWGIKRKMTSKMANKYAKTFLGIKNIHDCTGGFRAMKASALAGIDLDNLKTKGYAFQISLLEEFQKKKFVISEIPIHFLDREKGESKMRFADIAGVGFYVLATSLTNTFSSKKNKVNHAAAANLNTPMTSMPPQISYAENYTVEEHSNVHPWLTQPMHFINDTPEDFVSRDNEIASNA